MEDFDPEFVQTTEKHGYTIIRQIGKGQYGFVYLVNSSKYSIDFVIKRAANTTNSISEISFLKSLDSPFILKIYEYWQEGKYIYMVMNYCPNGSIQDYIDKNGAVDYKNFISWSRQALTAINYCHSVGIAHCDIKPANILIDPYNRVQVGDFGLSQDVNESIACPKGTMVTMAPELFSKKKFDPKIADIWSLGITFYMMVFGTSPYHISDINEYRNAVSEGNVLIPPEIDKDLNVLLHAMLQGNPNKRMSIDRILQLPIYSKERKNSNLCFTKPTVLRLNRNTKAILSMSNIDYNRPKIKGKSFGSLPRLKKI